MTKENEELERIIKEWLSISLRRKVFWQGKTQDEKIEKIEITYNGLGKPSGFAVTTNFKQRVFHYSDLAQAILSAGYVKKDSIEFCRYSLDKGYCLIKHKVCKNYKK